MLRLTGGHLGNMVKKHTDIIIMTRIVTALLELQRSFLCEL